MIENKFIYLEQYFLKEKKWQASEYPRQIVECLINDNWKAEVICGAKPYRDSNYLYQDSHSYKINLLKLLSIKNNILSKLLNDIFFSLKSFLILLKRNDYKLIICQTNPPTIVLVVYLISFLKKIDYIIIAMDIYPDVFFETYKNKKLKFVKKFIYFIFGKAYKKASKVVSLGEKMTEKLTQKGVYKKNIRRIYNWEPFLDSKHNMYKNQIRKPSFLKSNVLITYIGNFGTAHEWRSLVKAIKKSELKPSQLKFLFVSKGRELNNLKRYLKLENMSNFFVFKSPVSKPLLEKYLGYSDMGFVGIKEGFGGLVVPSKFATYISRGLPVLYIGEDSDIRRINKFYDCGLNFNTYQVSKISNFFRNIVSDKKILMQYSENAFNFYEKKMSRSIGLNSYKDLANQFKIN